ncbi:family 10 glycosylhydrolase [Litoribacter alkaliphilus]|uniref:Family 10 glycosylhydrolase n=1 Tax=Litoribacter ruber TaxID=702568 RepID=A0AAP2CMR4_9BACT|nr:family 10 glycosylhydrolase [Litoribacter alkaliphilus]MBS9525420.1 family 10 glycosylhydrolase [Litoribacter alkaliphilus]
MMKRLLVVLIALLTGNVHAQDSPKRELRAVWIATVENIDWPTTRNKSAQEQQEEYVKMLDHFQELGMNAIIMQVRPTADTFYPSSYEPWSAYLTGAQGRQPNTYYNPLTFLIQEAKKRGLEFHAWFNPYRASNSKDFIPHAEHPLVTNPEWFVHYGGKWYYDPGIPAAREFVFKSILETVKHYDLDAVHFDDYFYPYKVPNEDFPDSLSYKVYGQDYDHIDDWRRQNVDTFVEELGQRIKEEKPFVKFGISPFGVWRNKDMDEMGSDTKAGVTNYDDLYADVLKWLREGWIDYITPQLYWQIGFERAEYKTLVDWWSEHTFGRHLYIGQGVYRLGQDGWKEPLEVQNQINYNRENPKVNGSMYFSAKTFVNDQGGLNSKIKDVYPNKALVPTMPWIESESPAAPILDEITGSQGEGITLNWRDGLPYSNAYYAVYRVEGSEEQLDLENSANIIAIVQRSAYGDQHWTDGSAEKRTNYTYQITALDRLHNESEPSNAVQIRTRGRRGSIRLR